MLPGEDSDAAEVLEEVFQSRGGRLERGRAAGVRRTEKGVVVELTDGRTVEGSHALMTVGTVPNTGGLGLEKAGVELSPSGHVVVDRVSRTSVPGIYAAGDVTGVFQLASVAAMQGRIAMWHALGEAVTPIKLKTVAANVFTHPEIATVGVQEKTLPEDADVEVVRLPLATNARAKMSDLRDGFVKLFARRSTGAIVGGVVVAPGASELVLPIALAVTKGLTVSDLAHTFAIYPSLSGLDHRGRPAADGQPTTPPEAGRERARAAACDGCDGGSAELAVPAARAAADARGDAFRPDLPPPRRPRGAARLAVVLPLAASRRPRAGRRRDPAGRGRRVTGSLVQAWPESRRRPDAEAAEPLSWVQPASGAAVRVPTDDVAGVPAGATVRVTVGARRSADPRAGRPGTSTPAHDGASPAPCARRAAGHRADAGSGGTDEVTVVAADPSAPCRRRPPRRSSSTPSTGPVADFWSQQTGGAVAARRHRRATLGPAAPPDCTTPTSVWDQAAARPPASPPAPASTCSCYLADDLPGDLAGCCLRRWPRSGPGSAPAAGSTCATRCPR